MDNQDQYASLSVDKLRDRVMDDLTRGFSTDKLSEADYSSRCEKAVAATSQNELIALVSDLAVAPARPAPDESGLPYSINHGMVPEFQPVIAIFSGADFKGRWAPARSMGVLSLFGGSDLDFRNALIPPEGLTIRTLSIFGGCDIKLPPGVNVIANGLGVFGGFSKHYEHCEDPDAPVIHIQGLAVFGGCDIRTKR
jgi:hypothetical protein